MKPLHGTDLKRFLRDYKRQNRPIHDIALLLLSVEYPTNVGSIFRMADGAGVSRLWLSGITPTPPNPTVEKIGRYKHTRLDWQYEKEPLIALNQAKAAGYQLVAVELADGAVPYHDYEYPDRVCLVVGHEDHGVTKAALELCDAAVFLPMYGKGRSLNVAVALSIVTYHVLNVG
jgi:tRNA (guanosine-2'-O-)-methyltransferase